jgi:hypothetical protein
VLFRSKLEKSSFFDFMSPHLCRVHLFHKKNHEIYKDFNYTGRNELVLLAKMKLGRLAKEDISEYSWLLERWKLASPNYYFS